MSLVNFVLKKNLVFDLYFTDRIWDFLLEETKSTKLAVIITTHYIEETKKATKIGLMRGGVLLAEQSPTDILRTFHTTSLEDAFLLMCLKQGSDEARDHPNNLNNANADVIKDVIVTNNNHNHHHNNHIIANSNGHYHNNVVNDPKKTVITTESNKNVYRDSNFDDTPGKRRPSVMEKIKFTSKTRMKALLAKNFVQMIRQPA